MGSSFSRSKYCGCPPTALFWLGTTFSIHIIIWIYIKIKERIKRIMLNLCVNAKCGTPMLRNYKMHHLISLSWSTVWRGVGTTPLTHPFTRKHPTLSQIGRLIMAFLWYGVLSVLNNWMKWTSMFCGTCMPQMYEVLALQNEFQSNLGRRMRILQTTKSTQLIFDPHFTDLPFSFIFFFYLDEYEYTEQNY